MNDRNSPPFDELLSGLLDDRITEEALDELARRVAEDEECREQFLQQIEVAEGSSLVASGARSQERFAELLELRLDGESQKFDFLERGIDRLDRRNARRMLYGWLPWIGAALALCVLVGFWAGSWAARRVEQADGEVAGGGRTEREANGRAVTRPVDEPAAEPLDDSVAIVRSAVDVAWDGEFALAVGSTISPRESVQIKSGLLQLQFFRGATLTLQGPARLEIRNLDNVVLHEGRAWAHVPVPARGFTILTPDAEVVDLGTEFGVSVGGGRKTEVHVFDGLVELYEPNTNRAAELRHELTGGQAVAIDADGRIARLAASRNEMPPASLMEQKRQEQMQQNYRRWQAWRSRITDDPRVVLYYDFERPVDSAAATLPDRGSARGRGSANGASDGTIIGCSWAAGRWPERSALEFKRPSDRVRFQLAGEFHSVTLAAWLRVDGLDRRFNSLLLTDQWDDGEVHWQFDRTGQLGFSIGGAAGTPFHYSRPLVDLRRLGRWMHVATTFDGQDRTVRHFFNGRRLPREQSLDYRGPLRFGAAELGNWGRPLKGSSPIRNFNGRMDEFILFNAALSDEEIRAMYEAGNPF